MTRQPLVLHALHHARNRELSNSNFAGLFPVWDRLFHTFQHPDHFGRPDFGIEGETVPSGLLGQLAWPFRSRTAELDA